MKSYNEEENDRKQREKIISEKNTRDTNVGVRKRTRSNKLQNNETKITKIQIKKANKQQKSKKKCTNSKWNKCAKRN